MLTSTKRVSYLVFPSSLGYGGLVWDPNGLHRIHLPEATEPAAHATLSRIADLSDNAPDWLTSLCDDLTSYLAGASVQFGSPPLQFQHATAFAKKVYLAVSEIPYGRTASYAEIAERAGHPRSARAVGHALHLNPFPILIPCHRVLPKTGGIGGFTAPGGQETKRQLLALESARTG